LLRILISFILLLPLSVLANNQLDEEAVNWAKKLSGEPLPESILDDVYALQKESLSIIKNELGIANSVATNKAFAKAFYIFVSLSIPEKNLKAIAAEAKNYGATLVLRGLKENSYLKTASYLQELIEAEKIGFIIDPSLFAKYSVTSVPTFVLSALEEICPSNMTCLPGKFDKLVGNVTVKYALDKFKKEGEVW
jgi:type-F conjugative transfer system pilin assembly protein TrbC